MIPAAALPRRAVPLLVAAALLMGGVSACSKAATPVGLPPFADLVDEVSPSVVNISTVPQDEPAAPGAQEGGEAQERMREWLRRHFDEGNPGAEPPAGEAPALPDGEAGEEEGYDELPGDEQSLGSGFVLWQDGYVITNAHVVKGAKEILVRLQDRRELPATVVGLDPASDIALLKVEASDLPAVKTGDSKRLRVGEWVMAIGSPFGFDYSVTAGIVSAKGRSLFTEQYVPFIQTDAAINPGNSGGPLFNLAGEVVGVNSQIYSQTGGNSGIAFAIPIDVVLMVAEQLKDKGKVTRGWLGVVVQQVTRDLAKSFGLPKAEGALVARVVPDSPAAQAGIAPGDVILAFNGEPLLVSNALPPMVGAVAPGESVPVKLLREGKQLTLKVKIAELPEEVAEGGMSPAPRLPLGLTVEKLSAADRSAAGLAEGGVGVAEVLPGAAAKAGVRAGDILLSLSGQKINSPERFAEVAAQLPPGGTVPMLIQRNGAPIFLALDVPAGE